MRIKDIEAEKRQILADSLLSVDCLLTRAENLEFKTTLEKWTVYHALLEEMPLLEKLFTLTGYDGKEQLINRVRKITENICPASNLECFK